MVEEADGPVKKPKSLNLSPWNDMAKRRGAVVTIQPDEAAYMLQEWNTRNRHHSQKSESDLVRAIKDGRWRDNGEAIIFGSDGRLLNGQHRLRACVLTGVPIPASVSFGVDPDAFDTIDRGRRRNLGDDLSIVGEKNAGALAAALGVLWFDDEDRIEKLGRNASPPLDVAQRLLEDHPAIRESVAWASTHKHEIALEPRLIAYCHYRFSLSDANAAAKFFRDLVEGADLKVGDPVLRLRDMLKENKTNKVRPNPSSLLESVVKAWNARRSGKTISRKNLEEHNRAEVFPPVL
jgi:hypothetical protein